jgi:hypothetical protein
MSRLENWCLDHMGWIILAFALLGLWASLMSIKMGAEFTEACNKAGGIALHAGSPSKQQCVKDMGTVIILK